MRIFLLFLLVNVTVHAGVFKSTPDYSVRYEKSTYPSSKGARIVISCKFDADYNPSRELRFGINGTNETAKLDDNNTCELFRKPQKAVLQFYYDGNFQEIETDSVQFKIGHTTIISLHFKAINDPRPVKKPVIYLYPESDTRISVLLKPAGNLTFSYPDYASGWEGTAHPDGSIDINGTHYPYLFWESEQHFNSFDTKSGGFVISKKKVVESLEKYLTELGFNDKEKTDFITFWGPQLQQHEEVMIQFVLNEACDEFATLTIDPKPAHLNRVYMIWSTTNNLKPKFPKQQLLKKLERDGFDILEWGGIELKESNL